jgi:predicted acylesterase/phospholipase RssA
VENEPTTSNPHAAQWQGWGIARRKLGSLCWPAMSDPLPEHNPAPSGTSLSLLALPYTRLFLILFVLALSACTGKLNRASLAVEADTAKIAGYGEIRTFLDARAEEAPRDLLDWRPVVGREELNVLMISGGGSGGAFSVGVLSAWSKLNTRPQFNVVTGVSTGALIAPFAFLGPAYDGTITHLYTSGVAEDLVRTNGPVGLFGSSLLRGDPLRKMVEQFATTEILREIGSEHRKGRRLLLLTTNLDTQRAVVWNMGAIANSGRPDALKLFQDIIIASASIPGVYPAVMIKVESGGHQFEEMHSDGASASQILPLPQFLLNGTQRLAQNERQKVNFYVIVNNALMSEFYVTPNKTLSVAARAFSVLLKSQSQSELVALYNYCKLTKADFHVASIEAQVPYSMLDPFNTEYMRKVYNLGYRNTVAGTLWNDSPNFRQNAIIARP